MGAFLLLCGLVSIIFSIFSWVQKYVRKDVIHTIILALKNKSNIFILREYCKRTNCTFIVTLALLLLCWSYFQECKSCKKPSWICNWLQSPYFFCLNLTYKGGVIVSGLLVIYIRFIEFHYMTTNKSCEAKQNQP